VARRQLLAALLGCGCGAIALGCSPPGEPAVPSAPAAPPIVVGALPDLVSAASLGWLCELRPVELYAEPGLRPPLARLLRDERLDLFARTTGLELRSLEELALASFGDDSVLLLARHRTDPLLIERLFRARLTSDEHRFVDRAGIVRVTGRTGRQPRAFVALGSTVVGFQFGGALRTGPVRVAQLYASGAFDRVPPLSRDPQLEATLAALPKAPVRWLLPGPFEGELGAGAHGLLGAATAVGVALSPAGGSALALTALVEGSFEAEPERAAALLLTTWQDVAGSALGSLAGLHEPLGAPEARAEPGRLRLTVTLDAETLCAGLAAATMDDVREIMR
jgi:hypothetical protein